MPGSMEPPNDLDPVAGSSPSSSDSAHIPHLHDTPSFYTNSVVRWFRQFILPVIRHPQLSGSKLFCPTKTSRFPHELGVHDPTHNATSQLVTRAEEHVLDMSFNDQTCP